MEKQINEDYSKKLKKQHCQLILEKESISSDELEILLEGRASKLIDFNLIDTREYTEWISQRIKGCDYLIPTTSFYESLKQVEDQKEKPAVVYCLSGSRSAYCQIIMKNLGFSSISNLGEGIISYNGEIISDS